MDHPLVDSTETPTTQIAELNFSRGAIDAWSDPEGRHRNWPIVYTLNNNSEIYVGESLNATGRMRQHLESPEKQSLRQVRIILDDTFNKSACLDLESFLIRMFSGDGRFQVLNRNDGVTNADYFQRSGYETKFEAIFERLHAQGLFAKRIPEIENSDLFKLSPFKSLNMDQEAVIEDILEGLFADLATKTPNTAVIQGGPGTGKTIVAIYLLKLLVDIGNRADEDNPDAESVFSEFFTEGHPELLQGARLGLVIPQQSLRASIKKVFAKVPGLSPDMVVTPYQVAKAQVGYDLLIVDETHRLTQYGAQAMGTLTRDYRTNSQELARPGEDWTTLTQIDWIVRKSKHQVFLLDEGQGVRPTDVPANALSDLRVAAKAAERQYWLRSQMRVSAGDDYVGYVREVFSNSPPAAPKHFANYDLRYYDDATAMYDAIQARNAEHGLARLVAGYAWEWTSRPTKGEPNNPDAYDIDIDGLRLCWNRTATDWINSPTSLSEVGSIHTVQGYDLNYAGVIIGRDLRFNQQTGKIEFDREHYFDKKGKSNNGLRGLTYSDDDVLSMVRNIYAVLLTRGMKGTYVYVCDLALREHLRQYFPAAMEG